MVRPESAPRRRVPRGAGDSGVAAEPKGATAMLAMGKFGGGGAPGGGIGGGGA